MPTAIEIFCCYARKDQPLLQLLKNHLMPLQWQELIHIWSDTDINAGDEWEQSIHEHLENAEIILLLISADFMASSYCYSKEMRRAMQRHERGEARVIPIVLRPTYWKGAPFEKLQFLPKDAKPITDRSWTEDEALYDVVEQIGAPSEHYASIAHSLRPENSLMNYTMQKPSFSANRLSARTSNNLKLVISDTYVKRLSYASSNSSAQEPDLQKMLLGGRSLRLYPLLATGPTN
jgi:TIR domain